MIPSLRFDHPIGWYLLWNAVAFMATIPYCSFFEWCLHRFIMHQRTILFFPYKLHTLEHHTFFGADETFHLQDEAMKKHVPFVARDYILLLLVNLPIYIAIEWWTSRPIVIGCLLLTLTYLQAFNTLHWSWHIPEGRFYEAWPWFLRMKERHRLHHARPTRNFNLVCPLADLVLGTYVLKESRISEKQ